MKAAYTDRKWYAAEIKLLNYSIRLNKHLVLLHFVHVQANKYMVEELQTFNQREECKQHISTLVSRLLITNLRLRKPMELKMQDHSMIKTHPLLFHVQDQV